MTVDLKAKLPPAVSVTAFSDPKRPRTKSLAFNVVTPGEAWGGLLPPEQCEPWSLDVAKPEAWSNAQLTTVPVGSFAPVYAMICPLAAVGVPPVSVTVVVTEERAAEVVPTHSSIRAAQLFGVRVCLGAAWNVIPEAEGGVDVETVIV